MNMYQWKKLTPEAMKRIDALDTEYRVIYGKPDEHIYKIVRRYINTSLFNNKYFSFTSKLFTHGESADSREACANNVARCLWREMQLQNNKALIIHAMSDIVRNYHQFDPARQAVVQVINEYNFNLVLLDPLSKEPLMTLSDVNL